MAPSPQNRFAAGLSTWLLVEGVWGLFSPYVFAVLRTNHVHASIHVLLGLIGLSAAFRNHARGFLWFVGLLLLAVGVLFFVPAGRPLTEPLAVNTPVAVLNIVLGGFAVLCAAKCSSDWRPRASR